MTNIVPMPEALTMIGARIDAAYQRTQKGQREWIEGTLQLAEAFAAARERFPSDIAFGIWCAENSHDRVNSDDRAALISYVGKSVSCTHRLRGDRAPVVAIDLAT